MSAMNMTLPPVRVEQAGSSSAVKRLHNKLKININGDLDPLEESFNMDGVIKIIMNNIS